MSDTVETPTAEAPVVEATPAPVAEPKPTSTEILSLAKKEAQFRKQEVEYKTKLAEAQKELEELKYFRNAKDVVGKDPEALLEKLGISYDELTKSILDFYDNKEKATKPPTVEEVRKQVEEEFAKRESSAQAAAADAAIKEFTSEINTFVKENENNYPHLVKLGSTLGGTESADDLIFQVVSNYFEETGQLLDLKSAAETAEEYFRDEWNKLNGVLSGKKDAPLADAPKTAVNAPVAAPASSDVKGEVTINSDGSVSKNSFKVRDLPTITNNMRPVSSVPYRHRNDDRRDIIERAVSTYENVARRAK